MMRRRDAKFQSTGSGEPLTPPELNLPAAHVGLGELNTQGYVFYAAGDHAVLKKAGRASFWVHQILRHSVRAWACHLNRFVLLQFVNPCVLQNVTRIRRAGRRRFRGYRAAAHGVVRMECCLAFWRLIDGIDAYCEYRCQFLDLPFGLQRLQW